MADDHVGVPCCPLDTHTSPGASVSHRTVTGTEKLSDLLCFPYHGKKQLVYKYYEKSNPFWISECYYMNKNML